MRHPLHRNWADARLHQALRAMAVPNQALAPVRQPHLPHGGQERLGFRFDGLCQQPAGAVSQAWAIRRTGPWWPLIRPVPGHGTGGLAEDAG